jgi:hypothetical protein
MTIMQLGLGRAKHIQHVQQNLDVSYLQQGSWLDVPKFLSPDSVCIGQTELHVWEVSQKLKP